MSPINGPCRRRCHLAAVVAAMWVVTANVHPALAADSANTSDTPSQAEAQRLVAAAVQAELAGDVGYLSLLHSALRCDPENKVAHWQLGHVQVDGQWVSVEEAQRRAAADPWQAEYRERRAAAGNNLQDQIRLARWCRAKKLGDEAQLHWAVVLSLDPMNKEAQRAVDMLWKDGRLVNRNASSERKRQMQAARDAAKHWEPIIAKWQRAVSGRDVPAHDAALTEIRAIQRLDAIPSMEAVTLGRDAYDVKHAEECLQIAVAFLESLAKMPDQAATQSIVRHAVLSPGDKARNAAIADLKNRDQHDYVPMLLAGLAMPIESSYRLTETPDGSIYYMHALFQQGQSLDRAVDISHSTEQYYFAGKKYRYYLRQKKLEEIDSLPIRHMQMSAVASRSREKYVLAASNIESAVATANYQIEVLSAQIITALSATTGKTLQSPDQWWDWWRDNNGYYESEHPVDQQYYSDSNHYYYGSPIDCVTQYDPSCFVKGTPVWTKTGHAPVETVELGDFVLSQNVNTGELTYKPVLAKTVRPPSKMLIISLDGEQITATLGHPFWVAGTGWRMAKELGDDARLHGISGSSRVHSVTPAADAEAYNLVVADYSTYFVGASGILVHDNTPRQPTQAILPGIAKE